LADKHYNIGACSEGLQAIGKARTAENADEMVSNYYNHCRAYPFGRGFPGSQMYRFFGDAGWNIIRKLLDSGDWDLVRIGLNSFPFVSEYEVDELATPARKSVKPYLHFAVEEMTRDVWMLTSLLGHHNGRVRTFGLKVLLGLAEMFSPDYGDSRGNKGLAKHTYRLLCQYGIPERIGNMRNDEFGELREIAEDILEAIESLRLRLETVEGWSSNSDT
jgi:hypothetical protein